MNTPSIARGYFGIGIYDPKKNINIGSLLRSSLAFGADFVFTIGCRYKKDKANTPKAEKHLPLWEFTSFQDFYEAKPRGSKLVGVEYQELNSIVSFIHPERCVYLLGAEDVGLSPEILDKCDSTISIPTKICLNVATCGSIILFDRISKQVRKGV